MTLKLDPHNPLATKVQTRDGRKARIICTDRKQSGYPIIALLGEFEDEWKAYRDNGMRDCTMQTRHDLINVPETKSYWVNVYDDRPYYPFSTRKEADDRASSARTSLIELRMCDGKLVDAIQHEVEK